MLNFDIFSRNMMTSDLKLINTKLDAHLQFKFDLIKERIGIQNDAEVLRFLIAKYYVDHFEKNNQQTQRDYEKALPFIRDVMDSYGEEWKNLGE